MLPHLVSSLRVRAAGRQVEPNISEICDAHIAKISIICSLYIYYVAKLVSGWLCMLFTCLQWYWECLSTAFRSINDSECYHLSSCAPAIASCHYHTSIMSHYNISHCNTCSSVLSHNDQTHLLSAHPYLHFSECSGGIVFLVSSGFFSSCTA